MPDYVTVTVKFRCKKEYAEEFKMELEAMIDDFIDGSIAEKDGEIEIIE